MNEVTMAAFYDELTKHAGVPGLSSLKNKILNKFTEAGMGLERRGKALHEKFKKTSSVKEAGMLKSYWGHLTGRTAEAAKKSLLGASREVGAAKSNLAKETVKFRQGAGETSPGFLKGLFFILRAEMRDPATSAARKKNLAGLLKRWGKDPKKTRGALVNRKLKAFQSAGSRHSASLDARLQRAFRRVETKIKHQRAVYSRRRTRVLTGGAATGVLGGAGYEGYQHYKKKA